MKRYLITISIFLALWAAFKAGRYIYFKPKVNKGEAAPEFSAKLLDGTTFKLSDNKGKFILLHFWGSWCPPCRRENPEIKKMYDDFHDKKFKNATGFAILSIGIEADEIRWQNAMFQDQLIWKSQTSDINMFEGTIANLYGIKQIPTLIMISPDQEVLGTAWTPATIREMLTEDLIK